MKYTNIIDIIGNTPLLKLKTDEESADVFVKLESQNPGGSVKDRPALYMVKAAIEAGLLKKGSTIIEASSGNMGVSLSMIGAALGYKVIIVMPESMSLERRSLITAYGAELVLTPAALGTKGSLDKVEELLENNPNYVYLKQFENKANLQAHKETTSQEILAALSHVDAFVAGIGTGGSVSGIGEVLKQNDANTLVYGVEPTSSPVLTKGTTGPHKIQGIGAGIVPEILNRNVIDEIVTIDDNDAIHEAQKLAKSGILCGISSGANVFVAKEIAKKLGKGKTVVTLITDTGSRYLSTVLFNEGK